ncbi:MAG TPA: hypothetical protein VE090_03485 [Methylomirabilota bacterium]|nr:hypothetical protein [Methylomirabilota bacterium]
MIEKGERRTALTPKEKEHLRTISQKGPVLINDPQHGALHGTSLEAIDNLSQQRKLPGRTTRRRELDYEPGDISVYPTPSVADVIREQEIGSRFIIEQIESNPEKSRNDAINYAKIIAQRHAALRIMEIPISQEIGGMPGAVDDLIRHGETHFFRERRIPKETFTLARTEALKRKGFLLGIATSTIKNNPEIILMEGDPNNEDARLRTGERGLRVADLSGIEPLGLIEEKFLKELIKKE